MFSVPSSVYWIAQRYKLPVLTVVLNNGGKAIWQQGDHPLVTDVAEQDGTHHVNHSSSSILMVLAQPWTITS